MNERAAQVAAIVAGVVLIVVYSVLMTATEGTTAWSWVLLLAGIILLVSGGRLLRRDSSR